MLKIIHVVENLDKGAVENWLIRTFLESRKTHPNWKWTFYCILGKEGRLDEAVKAAGGEIIYSPYWISDKYRFLQFLRQTLKRGKYDIIHSHHDYLSGFYLLATAGIHFKKRILQIHNTDKALPVGSEKLHQMLLPLFKKSAIYFSNTIVGISNDTLAEFIGKTQLKKKRSAVLYYGIDLKPFIHPSTDNDSIYSELNLPRNAKILLFVGRMNVLKNPVFVVDILAALTKMRNDAYAVFIGSGDEATVLQRANGYDIQEKIRFAGWRNDTANIMKMAHVFVFPRIEFPKEGLGLVVVEAQAAGLSMMLSYGIVEDAIEIKELAHFLALDKGAVVWASAIDRLLNEPATISKSRSYERMKESKFEMSKAAAAFIALYE